MSDIMLLSVVIPAYNEDDYLLETIRRIQSVFLENVDQEIILVDDGSTDGTTDLLRTLEEENGTNDSEIPSERPGESLRTDNLKTVINAKNRGEVVALRIGFDQVAGDVIVVQDADWENDPEDFEKLLSPCGRTRPTSAMVPGFSGGLNGAIPSSLPRK